MSESTPHVIKLGGSLLDPKGLPDLVERFGRWWSAQGSERGLLVVGGGEAADIVRGLDAAFKLIPEQAHWLAIRAMGLNAHLIAAVMRDIVVVSNLEECSKVWAQSRLAIVDPVAWLTQEEAKGISIPHRWSYTSDSIAAHIAVQVKAGLLTMLKSTLPPSDCGLACAAGLGIVDEDFPLAAASIERVELVNLRSERFERCCLVAGKARGSFRDAGF